ncbi:methoxymalonate biosynthesis acyl carrier protein [Prauserella aidingensis]|uniref:acyl carrier protein n=1 Tax=Prauserella aidingensis TaxID=387890 RepID=UPI0020A3FD24|nr:phosphopantetheine-binding protein [Prauserella aidingensis]MCP2251344.1 methoxymalonate biosynthesis acyl carrier protein [Prauserella aidingensis]
MTTTPRPVDPASDEVAERISRFVAEHTRTSWEHDTDLFATAGLSSMFAMELVVFLEKNFDIEIAGPDLKLANFRTIELMAQLVARLRESDEDARG